MNLKKQTFINKRIFCVKLKSYFSSVLRKLSSVGKNNT